MVQLDRGLEWGRSLGVHKPGRDGSLGVEGTLAWKATGKV